MSKKFYICHHCGNLVEAIKNDGVPMMCCGEKMEAIVPNTTDAAGEKHLPCVSLESGAVHVKIGEVEHPMTPAHYIEWVYLETENGAQRKNFKPNEKPEFSFCIGDDKPLAVYAYCNLHGLWKTEL